MAHKAIDGPGMSLYFSMEGRGFTIEDPDYSIGLPSHEKILLIWHQQLDTVYVRLFDTFVCSQKLH